MSRVQELQARLDSGFVSTGSSFAALLDATTTAPPASEAAHPATVERSFGAYLGGGGFLPVAATPHSTHPDDYLAAHGLTGRNGHLDASDLVEVSGGWHGHARLLPPAAAAWESMRSAAAADGIDLLAIDTYRSYDVQEHAHGEYLAGRKGAYVAPPGHSEHGYGLAVDITNGSLVGPGDVEWEWLQANGRRFGWHPISNESWHWEYRG